MHQSSPSGAARQNQQPSPIGLPGGVRGVGACSAAKRRSAARSRSIKPAEWTPLVSLYLAELCQEAGLPAGLLSVLPGPGRVVGDSIVRHPDVKKVTFTGGTATGRSIAAIAAEKLMPVSLELGGKSPNIVLDDADLDHAINGVLFGIFSSTGQSCIAGSRIFVHKHIVETFTEELVRRTKALRVGSPLDPATQVGPMVAKAHRDQVAAHVERGVGDGGELLCGGAAPSDLRLRDGAYYLPTLLSGLPNSSAICQQEIFGPVGVIIPFEDEDDLIAQCNDSVYGLAAGIWTQDFARAWKLAVKIQTGTVWINTYKQFSISTPFGGIKDSGLGREKGLEGIRAYSNQKGIYVGMNTAPLPWAE